MKTNEILKRLKVMLGVEEKEEMRSLATLIDGTEVFVMEGDIAPGAILNVVTESEEQLLAPEGIHETTDGLLITVKEGGEIVSVEPKSTEPVEPAESVEAGYEEKKEEMEEVVVEIEAPAGAEDATEALLEGMAEILKPFIEEIKVMSEEFKKIKQRFEAIADTPGSSKIKTKMSSIKEDADEVEKKIEILKKIRKGK